MAESVIRSYFPSQVVSDLEKLSYDYGLKVAKLLSKSGLIMIEIETVDLRLIKIIFII